MGAASSCSQVVRVDRSGPAPSGHSTSFGRRNFDEVPRIVRRLPRKTGEVGGSGVRAASLRSWKVRGVTQGRMDRSLSGWLCEGEGAAGCGAGAFRSCGAPPASGRAGHRHPRGAILPKRRGLPKKKGATSRGTDESVIGVPPGRTGCNAALRGHTFRSSIAGFDSRHRALVLRRRELGHRFRSPRKGRSNRGRGYADAARGNAGD
jgi:hypothetical protein